MNPKRLHDLFCAAFLGFVCFWFLTEIVPGFLASVIGGWR